MFPKIIHKVWFDLGKGPIPTEKYQEKIRILEKLNPDFTIKVWGEENSKELIKTYYPNYFGLWEKYKTKVYHLDVIRYFILHHFGGFYVDTDILFYTSINEIIKDYGDKKVLLVGTIKKEFVSNYFFASVPNHPLFTHILTCLFESQNTIFHHKNSFFGVMNVSGPWFLTKHSKRFRKEDPSVFTIPIEHFYEKKQKTKVTSYGYHEYHGTWNHFGSFSRMMESPDTVIILASIVGFLLIIFVIIIICSFYIRPKKKK
jgi:mannosyltransferase OCH1-like enzyme